MNDMDLFGTETTTDTAPVVVEQLGLFATEAFTRPKPLPVAVKAPKFADQLDLFSN
jgi:hypothetical protein